MGILNIEQDAKSLLGDAIRNTSSADIEEIKDKALEMHLERCEIVHYSEALEIISAFESQYAYYVEECEVTIEMSNWKEPMIAWAEALYSRALMEALYELLEGAGEMLESMVEEVERLGGDASYIEISDDCQYGWGAHNYETIDGVLIWSDEHDPADGAFNPRLLEGELVAVASPLGGGLWGNACWNPNKAN